VRATFERCYRRSLATQPKTKGERTRSPFHLIRHSILLCDFTAHSVRPDGVPYGGRHCDGAFYVCDDVFWLGLAPVPALLSPAKLPIV
jgi:hypothetical protein